MKISKDHWWWKFLDYCSKADRYPWVPWRGRVADHYYPAD